MLVQDVTGIRSYYDSYTTTISGSRETGSRASISAHAIMPYKEQPITARDQVMWGMILLTGYPKFQPDIS